MITISRSNDETYRGILEHRIHAYKDVISQDVRVSGSLDKILYNAELLGDYCIGRAGLNENKKMADMYRYCVSKHLGEWVDYLKTLPEDTHKVEPCIISMCYARSFFDELIKPYIVDGGGVI